MSFRIRSWHQKTNHGGPQRSKWTKLFGSLMDWRCLELLGRTGTVHAKLCKLSAHRLVCFRAININRMVDARLVCESARTVAAAESGAPRNYGHQKRPCIDLGSKPTARYPQGCRAGCWLVKVDCFEHCYATTLHTRCLAGHN